MDYKKRFDKIVEKIRDRKEIEGIDKIYLGYNGFISVNAKGLDITRGCDKNGFYEIAFSGKIYNWEDFENLQEIIKEWFSYVEEKVNADCPPSEVVVDGRTYKLVE